MQDLQQVMVSGPNLNETSIVSGGYGGTAEGIIPTGSIKGSDGPDVLNLINATISLLHAFGRYLHSAVVLPRRAARFYFIFLKHEIKLSLGPWKEN